MRVDVYRSSGPGGQSVNTTDSAVRITHIPTGTVVSCQNEKSQLQNKASAMVILKAKLLALKKAEERAQLDELRGDVQGSWGDQMRSYVLHPYQMVKDLRTEYEIGNPRRLRRRDRRVHRGRHPLAPGRGRTVPVEHRFGGLDRRSFVPALVVVGIWLLWAVALPHLDGAIDHDDQVQAGERFAISEDLAITPPPGWSVIDGFRTSDVPATGSDGATFSNGTVTVYVDTDDYTGTPSDLLEQIDKVTSATGTVESFHVTDGRATVSTNSGLTGVSESYTGRGFEGTITAFVSDGTASRS